MQQKKGIKNYQNMSREKLLNTLDESERILKNLSQNGLERIARMQNLSQNELKQFTKMKNLSKNELKQIAKTRDIKNYKNMSKEELLISLLKSELSVAGFRKTKSSNAEIEEIKKKFNALRNNFSKEKIKEIRKKFHESEKIARHLKGLENKSGLKNETKHCTKELKKVEEFFKKLEKDLDRLEKHRCRDNDDLNYKGIRQIENLFNKIDEDYYKPIRTKGAFNNNYIEYESRGDKDKKLSVKEYLFMIVPCLGDMINNHKAPIRDCNSIIIKDNLSGV